MRRRRKVLEDLIRRATAANGPAECGPEVLIEPESVQGGAGPSPEARSVVAALTANGVGAGGGADDNAGQAGHLVAGTLGATPISAWICGRLAQALEGT